MNLLHSDGRGGTGPIDIKTGTPGAIKASNPAADELLKRMMGLFDETSPLRSQLINRSNQFMGGSLDVTASPVYTATQANAAQQYGNAKNNILSTLPQGGALMEALAGADLDRARTMTQAAGSIATDELNRAGALAGQGATISSQGMGTAGLAQAQQASARAQERTAVIKAKGEIWGGAGSAMGGK